MRQGKTVVGQIGKVSIAKQKKLPTKKNKQTKKSCDI